MTTPVIEWHSRTYLPDLHEYLYASMHRIGSCIYSEFLVFIALVPYGQAIIYSDSKNWYIPEDDLKPKVYLSYHINKFIVCPCLATIRLKKVTPILKKSVMWVVDISLQASLWRVCKTSERDLEL